MTRSLKFAPVLLGLLAALPLHARQAPSFRARALGVRVDALVTDGRRPVPGLEAQDFEVRDNDVVQSVELVDIADVPINAVLALDTSGSTDGTRQAELAAAGEMLLDGLKDGDRAALMTFNHAVRPRTGLTGDFPLVRRALRDIEPSGRTAVMDAAFVALTATLDQPGRSLVVVCTDGNDISSWLQPDDVIEAAKRSNAVVYAVASADVGRVSALEALTTTTGGSTLRISSTGGLRDSLKGILQEFRSRYILVYSPDGVSPGGFHRLDVRVKRRGVIVKARPGYIGAEAVK